MRKIMVAYDGSLLSRKAIQEAKRQAAVTPVSEVHIVTVIKATGPSTNVLLSRNIENELADKFRPQMESIKREFENENIPVYTDFLFGENNQNPGEKICSYAENNAIDLIIVGSRGLGKVKNLLLGSVSNNIVHHATCPVLIMK
ncbi:universal stress protein [Lentibacillus sp. N15]|uniref:universal stress protein n=1 Tax=Lentibacillus songyuanensis TaxID=3136161 RepID=UPI0031BAAE87